MDLSLVTVPQIAAASCGSIAILFSAAGAIRLATSGRRWRAKVGGTELSSGEGCDCSMRGTIMETHRLVVDLVKSNNIQTRNITALRKVQRPIIKALRSHSYALREIGANGSVEKALGHVNAAEDALNASVDDTAEEAMTTKEVSA